MAKRRVERLFNIIPIITTAWVLRWLCGAALIICIMLFSFGHVFTGGFFVVRLVLLFDFLFCH